MSEANHTKRTPRIDRPDTPIARYLDSDNRLFVWPSKATDKLHAVTFLATHFTPGKSYTERDVNILLDGVHTFHDPCLLRRELCDRGFLTRERNGASYQLAIAEEHIASE